MNVVLAHGLFGFRTLFGVNYFNGVQEFLEQTFQDLPIRVLVTEVESVGRIELRGKQLGDQINEAFGSGQLDRGAKTHIIGHSMGGLDGRFCLAPANANNIAENVTSLTTIATPHRGSHIADLVTGGNLLDRLNFTLPLAPEGVREWVRGLDLSSAGLADLTTAAMKQFNDTFKDHPDVAYFSYAAIGRSGLKRTCKLFLPTHALIGETNDGMVAESSAVWGEAPVETWHADHADAIGHDLDGGLTATPGDFDYLAKYAQIVEKLATM